MRRLLSVVVIPAALIAQTPKDVRATAKQGPAAIPTVAQYLNSSDVSTRVEAVKQLINLGGKDTIDPLIRATQDADPEVQIRATDGLVNFYLPGYVKTGLGSTIRRAGSSLKARFSESNDQVIDSFVMVRPQVIAALGKLARGGSSMDARANAARALGILRGRAALPDLTETLRAKDNDVIYESLVAMQKMGDPAAGPKVTYLLRDLDDRVQTTAIETAGLLKSKDALPSLRAVVSSPRNSKVERAALTAIAMMPDAIDRALFTTYLDSKDEKLRGAAAEGLGRIGNPADVTALDKLWQEEEKMTPRLAAAFALVQAGHLELAEASPLQYLLNTLNSAAYRGVATAYLEEAARRPQVRTVLYTPMEQGTRDEKINLARVFAASGNDTAIPYLEKLSRDADGEVAQEGLRALRSLKARLGV